MEPFHSEPGTTDTLLIVGVRPRREIKIRNVILIIDSGGGGEVLARPVTYGTPQLCRAL